MLKRTRYQTLDSGIATSVGRVRKINEDTPFVSHDLGLWAVADGMGGYAHGDVASQTVIAELNNLGRPVSLEDQRARIFHRVWRAHARISGHAKEAGIANVGSTVVALGVFGDHYSCVWSGDSRCYRIRSSMMNQVSKDHTQVQTLLDRGQITPEEAREWPRRNVITRAVGISDDPRCDAVMGEIMPNDVFLLCSDGLTEHLSDDVILETVLAGLRVRMSAQGISEKLIADTEQAGARDNVTVVMARFLGAPIALVVEDEVTEATDMHDMDDTLAIWDDPEMEVAPDPEMTEKPMAAGSDDGELDDAEGNKDV
jgi:protein phosphatase